MNYDDRYGNAARPMKNALKPAVPKVDTQAKTVEGGHVNMPGKAKASDWQSHRQWAKDFNKKIKQ